MVKRFDVWVTRHHWKNNQIRVSNAATTGIERVSGCTIFRRIGRAYGRDISPATCLRRYGFLPRPAECWNVWVDVKGIMQYQEYPILEKYRGTFYKPKPIKKEQEYYL